MLLRLVVRKIFVIYLQFYELHYFYCIKTLLLDD